MLSDAAEICCKCDDIYHPNDEGGLLWSDPDIGIEWPALDGNATFDPEKLVLNERDASLPRMKDVFRERGESG